MNEQIMLSGFEPPHEKELATYEKILPVLREAADMAGGDGDLITIKHGKSYSSIWFGSLLAFRLCLRKNNYIEVSADLKDKVLQLGPLSEQKPVAGRFWRVNLDEDAIANNAAVLGDVVKATVDRTPKEWDCCSRYLDCSDAKGCVHPDKKVALLCGYRQVLNSGRIFYGKNRNV